MDATGDAAREDYGAWGNLQLLCSSSTVCAPGLFPE
jgi:hypothetical protein